jgi:peptidoglycan/LPS O-acetylase OafA/YrhL
MAAGALLWVPNLFIEPSSGVIRTLGLTGTLLGAAAFLIAIYNTQEQDFGWHAAYMTPVASLVGWIGVYSYGIYLWHVTAIGILEREFTLRLISWSGGSSSSLIWWGSVLVVGAGAILAGVVASKVVEWPILRLRDRLFPSRSGSLPCAFSLKEREDFASAAMPAAETQRVVSSITDH